MAKFDGFDKLQKDLNKTSKKLKELENSNSVPLEELLNNRFLRKYTKFKNLDEILNKFSIETNEDIENNIEKIDKEVKDKSNFNSWQEMLEEAGVEYLEKQLDNIFK